MSEHTARVGDQKLADQERWLGFLSISLFSYHAVKAAAPVARRGNIFSPHEETQLFI